MSENEQLINDLFEKIEQKDIEIKELKNNSLNLHQKIKELEEQLKNKDILLNNIQKINQELTNKISELQNNDKKDYELMKKFLEKDEELKMLKELNLLPFTLSKGEKLMNVIFISDDEKVHIPIICKNTDLFTRIENVLYDEYPEYREYENYFILNGKKINKNLNLEKNMINNNDIIILKTIE